MVARRYKKLKIEKYILDLGKELNIIDVNLRLLETYLFKNKT